MENLTLKEENLAYKKAEKRVKELKGFYGNLTSYCLVIPFLIILNLITSPGYLWFYWAMLGWGLGLTLHAVSIFGIGKSWEERKIRELMNKERYETKKNI